MTHLRRTLAALTVTALPLSVLAGVTPSPAGAWEGAPGRPGGHVLAAGSAPGGATSTPEPPTGAHAVAVTTSELFSVVVWSDGSVTPFGDDGTPPPEPCPPDPQEPCLDLPTPLFGGLPAPPAGQQYVGAAAGATHGLLLTDAGRLVGFGTSSHLAEVPPALPAGLRWTGAAAGDRWSVALRSDGEAIGFGYTSHHRRDVPDLTGDLRYTDVAAGERHGVALVSDGTLRTWGDSSDQRRNIFADAGNGRTYLMVAASGAHTAAVRSDYTVVAAGDGMQGVVATIPLGRHAVDLALGDDHGLVLLDDGTVLSFGEDDQDQGTAPPLDGSRQITGLAAGGDHSLFLTAQAPAYAAASTITVPYGTPTSVEVALTTGQYQPTGAVRTLLGGAPYATTALVDGVARVRVPAGLPVGEAFLYHRYDGDDRTAPLVPDGSHSTQVVVTRAVPTIAAARSGKPATIRRAGKISVRVTAGVLPVGGKVVVRKGKRVLRATTVTPTIGGRALIRLPRLPRGKHTLTIAYAGSPQAVAGSKTLTLRVRR
jgi:hypothetical protein